MHEIIDHAVQAGLILLSTAAIWLVGGKSRFRRWGYVAGVASEPLWLYTSWVNGQWGVFLLSIVYGILWARGAWNHWNDDPPSDDVAP